jgi:hypothetical protein
MGSQQTFAFPKSSDSECRLSGLFTVLKFGCCSANDISINVGLCQKWTFTECYRVLI